MYKGPEGAASEEASRRRLVNKCHMDGVDYMDLVHAARMKVVYQQQNGVVYQILGLPRPIW